MFTWRNRAYGGETMLVLYWQRQERMQGEKSEVAYREVMVD
jgi:hypothetical protein